MEDSNKLAGEGANECSQDELVVAAGQSVQSQERLCFLMGRSSELEGDPPHQVVNECRELLDRLRLLKSDLEGSNYAAFSPFPLDASAMSQLKHLVLAHTPADLPEDQKAKIVNQLADLLDGRVKQLLYACLLTCPWYSSAQAEVSSKANRNVIFVVYVALDEQFFSLNTPHNKAMMETADLGFMYICEVRHFCSEVLRGHVRSLEALYCPPECVLVCCPPWLRLVGLLHQCGILLHQGFLASCLGQAVGGVASCSKHSAGQLVLKAGVDLTTFSTSCRLLSYAASAVHGRSLQVWGCGPEFPECTDQTAVQAMTLLREGFAGNEVRRELLDCVLAWKKSLSEGSQPDSKSVGSWSPELAQWLADLRQQSLQVSLPEEVSQTDFRRLSELLHTLNLGSISPKNVLLVCLAGSRLYDLALPSSDKDYIVVFRQPTRDLLASIAQLTESRHNRGEQLPQEAGAYEARMLCDMLLKGAVNMVEILYAEDWFYCSPEWEELVAQRDRLLSEKVILQYVGYIKTHMSRIRSGKHAGTPREKKMYYSIFHKMLSLDAFTTGRSPVVRCAGEDKHFIMRIRNEPLEGDLSSDNLYRLAETRLSKVRADLRARRTRMKEFGDYHFLQNWLTKSVRGIRNFKYL